MDEEIVVRVTVTRETAREVERLLGALGWTCEAGLAHLVVAGLEYIEGKRSLQGYADCLGVNEDILLQLEQMPDTGARLAAVLVRVAEMEQVHRGYEATYGKMMDESAVHRERIWALRGEAEALQAEIRRLRAEIARRKLGIETSPPRAGWLERLRARKPGRDGGRR